MSSPDSTKQLNFLSLDGGGVRGLSSLLILDNLMRRIDPDNPPKPCEFFDLIGGTSTGGLIAVMLGLLEMDVGSCIDAFIELSQKVFVLKGNWGFLSKAKAMMSMKERFDSAKLKEAIIKVIEDQGRDREMMMFDQKNPFPRCKVFVCATQDSNAQNAYFRGYRVSRGSSRVNCKVWEACRATSAATTFFDPICIENLGEYVDGAVGQNNPINQVLAEAQDIWPDADKRIRCIISVGTGQPSFEKYGHNLKEIVNTLKSIATETERTAEVFLRAHQDLHKEERYFRFNVAKGLESVKLGEGEKAWEMHQATHTYLERQSVNMKMKRCAKSLGVPGKISDPILKTTGGQREALETAPKEDGEQRSTLGGALKAANRLDIIHDSTLKQVSNREDATNPVRGVANSQISISSLAPKEVNNQENISGIVLEPRMSSNPIVGTFSTMEVSDQPQQRNMMVVSFSSQYLAPPGVVVGFNMLDIGNGTDIRAKSYAKEVEDDRFTINIDSWGDTVLYKASCSWLEVAQNDLDIQFGTFDTLDDHPRDQQKDKTIHWVSFQRAYNAPPKVVVWINSFDLGRDSSWRLKVFANEITATGFLLHIETWGNTVLYSAGASWIAYPVGKANIFSGQFNTMDVRSWTNPQISTSGYVSFGSGVFDTPPHVVMAFSSMDIWWERNLRVLVRTSSITAAGMLWNIDTWQDSWLSSAGVGYIALG